MAKKAGRPKNTEGTDLVTLDECLLRTQEYLQLQKPAWSRRTLQNKLSKGEFQRYGTFKEPQVDWAEIKRSLHWKRKAS